MKLTLLVAGEMYLGYIPDRLGLSTRQGRPPQLAATFINQFLKVRGDFPTNFHLLGWVNSSDKSWWGMMVGFVLTELEDLLKQAGLCQAIRAIQYGIPQSSYHFYCIL